MWVEYRVRWGREPVRDQRAVGTDCIEIVQESASKDRRYGKPLRGFHGSLSIGQLAGAWTMESDTLWTVCSLWTKRTDSKQQRGVKPGGHHWYDWNEGQWVWHLPTQEAAAEVEAEAGLAGSCAADTQSETGRFLERKQLRPLYTPVTDNNDRSIKCFRVVL